MLGAWCSRILYTPNMRKTHMYKKDVKRLSRSHPWEIAIGHLQKCYPLTTFTEQKFILYAVKTSSFLRYKVRKKRVPARKNYKKA